MTEQEDKTVTTASPPEETAPAATPAAPKPKVAAQKPAGKPKATTPAASKPVEKAKPKATNKVPNLNNKAYPLHPERIWPD